MRVRTPPYAPSSPTSHSGQLQSPCKRPLRRFESDSRLQTAIHLLVTERAIAPLGQTSRVFYGGINRLSGLRSSIKVSSILLTQAKVVPRLLKITRTLII
jgi:hypothetical protein